MTNNSWYMTTLITLSILLGGIFTMSFLGQPDWQRLETCEVTNQFVDIEACVITKDGYPVSFLTTSVDVNDENIVFGTTELDTTNLFINWTIWSLTTFGVLYFFGKQFYPMLVQTKTTRRKTTKRKK